MMAKATAWLAWWWPNPRVAKEWAGLANDYLWWPDHRNHDVAVDGDGATGKERTGVARVMAVHAWHG